MWKQTRSLNIDNFGLIIIGAGAAVLYYIVERKIGVSSDVTMFLTIGLTISISCFTQYLLNTIKRSETALRETNENLDLQVKERTAELSRSKNTYRTIFENTGTATIIVDRNLNILMANSEFLHLIGHRRENIENSSNWLSFIEENDNRRKLQEM